MVQRLTLENMPPPEKKALVEQMIKLAKNLGQTDFLITDIRHFYDILAPQDPTTTTTDTCRHSRRRKRPAPKRHQDDKQQHQQDADDTHGGEV